MKCSICNYQNLYNFLTLGHQPPSNSFLRFEGLNKPETYYPLDVYYCENCGLVQLGYEVKPEILFRNYVYSTQTNKSLIKNFAELVDKIVARFKLAGKDLAVDIGSNDGTLLKGYLKYNIRILGIEPSNVAEIAIKNSVPTMKEFFNRDTPMKIVKKYGKAKVVTATNVFAHVKDIMSSVEGVKKLLSDDGIFICESHHILSLVTGMQWDSIYHEHLRYYSLKPLIYLFKLFNMDIFDAEKITTHGGSIRIYVCKKNMYPNSDNIAKILKEEESYGLYNKETFHEFAQKVKAHKIKIQEMLIGIKKEGKKIAGIGAPAKGNTLLNYCNITPDIMEYLVERSNLKIGLYTPGMHISIVDEKQLFDEQPDYALLLSWNIAEELIPKIKKLGYKGKIIVPVPWPHIVD